MEKSLGERKKEVWDLLRKHADMEEKHIVSEIKNTNTPAAVHLEQIMVDRRNTMLFLI
jgi:hypothetical protein